MKKNRKLSELGSDQKQAESMEESCENLIVGYADGRETRRRRLRCHTEANIYLYSEIMQNMKNSTKQLKSEAQDLKLEVPVSRHRVSLEINYTVG